ncbi:unnamed protein product, partial [Phaeothamnion confervicola]
GSCRPFCLLLRRRALIAGGAPTPSCLLGSSRDADYIDFKKHPMRWRQKRRSLFLCSRAYSPAGVRSFSLDYWRIRLVDACGTSTLAKSITPQGPTVGGAVRKTSAPLLNTWIAAAMLCMNPIFWRPKGVRALLHEDRLSEMHHVAMNHGQGGGSVDFTLGDRTWQSIDIPVYFFNVTQVLKNW